MARDIVGTAERTVLERLQECGGVWTRTSPPLWETAHWTLVLLESLAKKGYVSETAKDAEYRITAKGLRTSGAHPSWPNAYV